MLFFQIPYHKGKLNNFLNTTTSNPDPPFLFIVAIGNPVRIDAKRIQSQLGVSELKSRKTISTSHCVVFDEVLSRVDHFNESVIIKTKSHIDRYRKSVRHFLICLANECSLIDKLNILTASTKLSPTSH